MSKKTTESARLCALSMYLMWWKKPLLAQEPITIRSDALAELFPYMYMRSTVSGKIDKSQIKSQTAVKTVLAWLHVYSKIPEIEYVCFRSVEDEASVDRSDHTLPEKNMPGVSHTKLQPNSIDHYCRNERNRTFLDRDSSAAFFERKPRVRANTSAYIGTDATTSGRRRGLAEALNTGRIKMDSCKKHALEGGRSCWHIEAEEMLSIRSRNWPSDELLRSVDGLVVGIVLWLANFIYGGLHMAAWNDHFPTSFEKWMWRASAAYIAFCGGLWVALNSLVRRSSKLNDFWERWMEGEKGWFQNITLGTVVFICGSSLIVARVFIVVEAFVSIRQLPIEAYQTPKWSQIFPHF